MPCFTEVLQEHAQTTLTGQTRKRAAGGGRTGELDRPEDKLFFILVYFKLYPTQEVMGALFGFGQAQANKWILRLMPLLQAALMLRFTIIWEKIIVIIQGKCAEFIRIIQDGLKLRLT